VVFSFCRASPVQPFSNLSPPTWRARFHPVCVFLYSIHMSLKSCLILSFHLCLDDGNGLFPSEFLSNILQAYAFDVAASTVCSHNTRESGYIPRFVRSHRNGYSGFCCRLAGMLCNFICSSSILFYFCRI
jgi:hypothetical protein